MTSTTSRRRRRISGYAVVVLALGIVGAGYAAFAAPGRATADTSDASFQVAKGHELYQRGCSSCHGLDAQGGDQAPSLIGVGAAAVDFQLSTGRMPLTRLDAQPPRKKPVYSPDQISAIAAYVASLAPGPQIPTKEQVDPSGGDIAHGANLFRTNCAQCHNFTGQGGALANGRHAPPLNQATSTEIYEAMITGPAAMPVFSDRAIQPSEKRDIIAYVEHMRNQTDPGGANLGRVGPVTEGLVAWLVGLVAVIGVAIWIGAKAKKA